MPTKIYTVRHTGQVSQAQKTTKPGAAFNEKGEPLAKTTKSKK